MEAVRHKPIVFVSSTCYDLQQVREDLKDFFEENYGFQTMLSEFDSFPIDPCKGTYENCIENVDRVADIFVLIIGKRYGYAMENGKSITNLEYLHAKEKGIPILVFVDKQLYDNMKVWRSNRDANFDGIVDNYKIFEFVSELYDESKQWIYTYNSVRDIKMALKQQLCLIFCDGLIFKKVVGDSYSRIINSDISSNAVRVLVEKPYAWEFKFFAYVLKEVSQLKEKSRNFIDSCNTESASLDISDVANQPDDFRKIYIKIKMDHRISQIRFWGIELLNELKLYNSDAKVSELGKLISEYLTD